VAKALGLQNVEALHKRGEEEKGEYDFIVSRAVMQLPLLTKIIQKNISKKQDNALPNGLLCLKGGDLKEELKPYLNIVDVMPLEDMFDEEWFKEDKKLIYLPMA
jgi:16S rRNA (guanine527-N7)-methyltransferase